MSAKTELRVRCGDCDHRWVAVYLPMEMSKAAQIMKRACCPACGNASNRIYPDMPKAEPSHG